MAPTSVESINGNYPGKGIGTPVGVAVLGKGTVGTEVLRLISEFGPSLEQRIGGPIEVRGVAVSDVDKHKDAPEVQGLYLTDNARELVTRDDVALILSNSGETPELAACCCTFTELSASIFEVEEMRLSVVAAMKIRPPAVITGPPLLGVPISSGRCEGIFHGPFLRAVPNGRSHRVRPVRMSMAVIPP